MKKELDYKAIGGRIREVRLQRKISLQDLAEAVEISATHMSNIEVGNKPAGLSVLANIAQELNVSLDYLVYDETKPDRSKYEIEINQVLSNCTDREQAYIVQILHSMKDMLHTSNME